MKDKHTPKSQPREYTDEEKKKIIEFERSWYEAVRSSRIRYNHGKR